MTTKLTVDSAGRIVLPKPLRKQMDIGPGDTLELVSAGESITLRPVRNVTPLTKEKGVWVFRIGQPLSASITDEVLAKIRQGRDQQNSGISE